MSIDTHCHLNFEQYQNDRLDVFMRARESGLQYFINVGIDEVTSKEAIALAAKETDVYATVGLHPHSADQGQMPLYDRLESLMASKKVVAVGEIGLDYFKSEAMPQTQQKVFRNMLGLAGKARLPVVVHSRNAFKDTLAILRETKERFKDLKAVFHCFSYDKDCLQEALDEGFFVSFTGNVTFPTAHPIKASARHVPMDRFMLETDSPYLAPQPVRGKRNEPSFIHHQAECIADLKGCSLSEVIKATTENAIKFFGLPS
jgi:TatD DNase family protein